MDFMKVPGSAGDSLIGLYGQPVLVLLLVAPLVSLIRYLHPKQRRFRGRYWGRRADYQRPARFEALHDVADPARQMNFISKVGFDTVPLLNGEERRIYAILTEVLAGSETDFRLMAQTSLGEILRPRPGDRSRQDRELAFRSINSKRLDFAIFDQRGNLVLAIEYQGSGHYNQKSFIRDAVKREVLRKAGVPFLEVPVNMTPDDLARQVRRLLSGPGLGRDSRPMGERPRARPGSSVLPAATKD